MKFRILLWVLGWLMARASRRNTAFRQQLQGKSLVFQLQTRDGKVVRHFRVHDERVCSGAGPVAEPAFAIAFRDADYAFATLRAPNKQLAFMQGIQDKHIQIKGNPALVMWFQGLMKTMKTRKRS